ncbi:MAG: TlpA family protein disulfide reductase [Candidatus Marinarcus sp.]|uniref:TlpA family protein disulfide reductase n=1 Tax=Candidatus Marinarcus sp. TaxID=3100987 RepID=UPI003B00718F
MKNILIALFMLGVLSLFSGCNSETKKAQVIEENKRISVNTNTEKGLILTTLDGKNIDINLSDNILLSKALNGKIVLINFFATWCNPCIKEIPLLNRLYEKYGDKFEIVGVLFEKDKDKTELNEFISKYKIKFPVTVGDNNFIATRVFGDVQKVPESFLFSKEGFFVQKFIGIIDEEVLVNYINQ